MRVLGFDNYEGVLKIYLAKYREVNSASLCPLTSGLSFGQIGSLRWGEAEWM